MTSLSKPMIMNMSCLMGTYVRLGLNSHYIAPKSTEGHQPKSRVLFTHYKDIKGGMTISNIGSLESDTLFGVLHDFGSQQ